MAVELKFKKIKPLFNAILVTKEVYEDDQIVRMANLSAWDPINTKGKVKPYQTVVEAGPMSKVKPGDKVYLNLLRYAIPIAPTEKSNSIKNYGKTEGEIKGVGYRYDFTGLEYTVDGKDYLMLMDNDVQFVFEGEEVEVEIPEYLKSPAKKANLILPKVELVDSTGKKIK